MSDFWFNAFGDDVVYECLFSWANFFCVFVLHGFSCFGRGSFPSLFIPIIIQSEPRQVKTFLKIYFTLFSKFSLTSQDFYVIMGAAGERLNLVSLLYSALPRKDFTFHFTTLLGARGAF